MNISTSENVRTHKSLQRYPLKISRFTTNTIWNCLPLIRLICFTHTEFYFVLDLVWVFNRWIISQYVFIFNKYSKIILKITGHGNNESTFCLGKHQLELKNSFSNVCFQLAILCHRKNAPENPKNFYHKH